jgi:hypothetical protein
VNHEEAEFILVLYQCLTSKYPSLKELSNVAIISPYKQQVKLLRDMFRDAIGVEATRLIDINTVDGFQVPYSKLLPVYFLFFVSFIKKIRSMLELADVTIYKTNL